MAQDTTPAIVVYQGDGSNNVFSVPFDKGYYGEVKVLFVRRGLADYTYYPDTYVVNGRLYAWVNSTTYIYTHTPTPAVGAKTYNSGDVEQANTVSAIAGQTITVDDVVYSRAVQHDISDNLRVTWTGTTLAVGDFICIVRETERGQPYEMPNNQKHIERALDNIERQVQELQSATDSALKIDPSYDIQDSHKMDPVNWLKSIIRSMDFSIRALRYANGWLDYSLDDPNIADQDKTWYHLLNTDNIKSIRERSRIEDDRTIYWTEYQAEDGTWKTLCNPEDWDARIDEAKRIAEEAKEIAEDAKDVADEAKDTADEAKDTAEDAKETAEGIEDIAQEALDKVTQEITDRETADGDLQDQIDSLSGRGRFLALWNCATGLAETNPPESPYTYKAGDYFVVGTVSSATPAVNYKPDGSSYTTDVASTTVETNEVSVNDTYFYDGTVWKLQSNAQKEVSFSALAGSPYDNTNLSNALNAKQDVIQVSTMPVASADNLGSIVQWIGTTGTYTNGFFYKNVATTTASGTITQTFGASLSDITLDVETFQEQIDEAGTYVFTFDGSDWYYGDDTVDLGDYGISFSGDPVEDDELTVVITETTTYGWENILVQRGGVQATYNAITKTITFA